jgi:cysteine-rich repeat protein
MAFFRKSLASAAIVGAALSAGCGALLGIDDVNDDGGAPAGGGAAGAGDGGAPAGGGAGANQGGAGGRAGEGVNGTGRAGSAGGAGGAGAGGAGAGGASAARCGDGVWSRPAEECDDGNAADGDGCSAKCQVECGSGGDRDAAGHACYRLEGGDNFNEAAAQCRGAGKGFAAASVCNRHDEDFLLETYGGSFLSNALYWLGGRQADDQTEPDAAWSWVDGAPPAECDMGAVWGGGEPSDKDGLESGQAQCMMTALTRENLRVKAYDQSCFFGPAINIVCKRSGYSLLPEGGRIEGSF